MGKKSKQYRFSCYSEFTNIIPTRLEHKQHLHTSLSDSLLQRCHSLMRPRTLFLQARQETSRRTLLCRGCRTNLCPLTSSYAAPLSSSSCAQQKYRHVYTLGYLLVSYVCTIEVERHSSLSLSLLLFSLPTSFLLCSWSWRRTIFLRSACCSTGDRGGMEDDDVIRSFFSLCIVSSNSAIPN